MVIYIANEQNNGDSVLIKLLARIFIKKDAEKDSAVLRTQYGMLCGGFGIFLNIVLFGIKLFAGSVSGSPSTTSPMQAHRSSRS